MTKHTQGPWFIVTHSNGWTIQNKESATIAQQYGDSSKANATLIVAAPDMLEALKEAKLMLQGVALLDVVGNSNCSELADSIKSTINKAENNVDKMN